MSLSIFYPNGMVEAGLVYILDPLLQVPVPWDGSITVVSSGSAIADGVNSAIEASVIDYISGGGGAKKNPLAIQLIDLSGDPYTLSGIATETTLAALLTRFPALAALADDVANPSLSQISTFLMMYDGATWDRVRGTSADGLLVNLGANNDIQGDVASNVADSGNPVKIGLITKSSLPAALVADRRSNVIGDLTGRVLSRNAQQSLAGNYWDVQHVPAVNTQATITQASAGAGKRNVCTGFTVTICGGTTDPAAWQGSVAIIDGASGGGTYLWRSNISIPAVAGAMTSIVRSNIWIVGSQATAMTIEFSGAGGALTYESVTMEGTTVEE
jgi:hypothetical protein